MSMQDPISDMISRVMNAQARGHATVSFSSSKIKNAICSVLEKEGFISSFKIEGEESKKTILVSLKYHQESPVIRELKRISKPGLRKYFSSKPLAFCKALVSASIKQPLTSWMLSDTVDSERSRISYLSNRFLKEL